MIAKALTLDGQEVTGYYSEYLHMCMGNVKGHFIADVTHITQMQHEINPKTLKYKIGDEWYSMEELEEAMSFMHDSIVSDREQKQVQ